MPSEEIVRENVCAILLRGAWLNQEVAEVSAFALLRRLLVVELVQPRGDAALQQERQQRSPERENDQHPVETGQQCRHQKHRDDVPRETEHRPREVAGSPRDVALGARQPVVPVRVVEVAEVELRRFREQPPLRFELHTTNEQIAPVPHVCADRPLYPGGEPHADQDRKHVAEVQRPEPRFGDSIHERGAQVHGDRRDRRAEHSQQRVAQQRARRRRPRELDALLQVLPDSPGAALDDGGAVFHSLQGR